jgi:hypothetical protein
LGPINESMRRRGQVKPIWVTEFAYFADDKPSITPSPFELPRLESEKLLAAYMVRASTLMLANGVARIFYHASTSGTLNLNHTSLDDFIFDYASAPRKIYPVQAAMARLLPSDLKFVQRLPAPAGIRLYVFENQGGSIVVGWAEEGRKGQVSLRDPGEAAFDIEGNPLTGARFDLTEYPIYLRAEHVPTAKLIESLSIK